MAKKETKKKTDTGTKRARQSGPQSFVPGSQAWGVLILARPSWLMNTDGFVWWTPYEGVAQAQANYEGKGYEARPIMDNGNPGKPGGK